MSDSVKYYEQEDLGFAKLFYDVLFLPGQASQKIKHLREENSTKLFFYSAFIVLLSAFGLAAAQSSLIAVVTSVIFWFLTVVFFSLFAWLLRPKEAGVDFGSVFFFSAFAQAPLVFLGLSKLWENSVFPTTGPTMLCFAWSIILWGWGLANSLQLGNLKAGLLIALAFLLPVLVVLALLALGVLTLVSLFF